MYIWTDTNDPISLKPSNVLCDRRITRLPYLTDRQENIGSSTVSNCALLQLRAQRQQELMRRFLVRWKHEYSTTLREYHRVGQNKHSIDVGQAKMN